MLIGITIENDMDNKHAVQFLNAYIKRKMQKSNTTTTMQ